MLAILKNIFFIWTSGIRKPPVQLDGLNQTWIKSVPQLNMPISYQYHSSVLTPITSFSLFSKWVLYLYAF